MQSAFRAKVKRKYDGTQLKCSRQSFDRRCALHFRLFIVLRCQEPSIVLHFEMAIMTSFIWKFLFSAFYPFVFVPLQTKDGQSTQSAKCLHDGKWPFSLFMSYFLFIRTRIAQS